MPSCPMRPTTATAIPMITPISLSVNPAYTVPAAATCVTVFAALTTTASALVYCIFILLSYVVETLVANAEPRRKLDSLTAFVHIRRRYPVLVGVRIHAKYLGSGVPAPAPQVPCNPRQRDV